MLIKKVLISTSIILFLIHGAFSQAFPDTSAIQNIIHVNNTHPAASDDNTGQDPELPVKTLQKAINLCNDIPSRIKVHPGHYRAYIDILSNEVMIIEATEPGKVFISGSDVFRDWIPEDTLYSHAWEYDWGFFDDSNFCFGPCFLKDYQKRRELLFVNSTPMHQVLEKNELREGTFLVDEENDLIYLNLPDSIQMEDAFIEVSTRGYDRYNEGRNGSLIKASVFGGKGLIIRGLTIQHTANTAHQDALTISNTKNLLVENCIFEWNNGVGFEMQSCSDVTVRNCIARNNGERGMGVGGGENIILENIEIYRNNWRTNASKIISHDAAGIKLAGGINNCHLINIKAYENYCHAIWFDWNNGNYSIENSLIEHNQEAGIMVEASRKPALLRNNKIFYNGIGILGYGHANVRVDSCFLFANGSQISLGQDGRTVRQDNDWEINCENWEIKNSTIVSATPIQGMLSFFEYLNPSTHASTNYFQTAIADSNIYYHPKGDQQWPDGSSAGGGQLSFVEWKNQTVQDLHSVWMKPSAEEVGGNLPPVAKIDYNFFTDTIVQFYANESYDPEGLINSYRWYFGDGETSDKMNINHFYTAKGDMDVSLVVTDFFGESDSVSVSIFVGPTSVQEHPANVLSSVFPNPVTSEIYLNVASDHNAKNAFIRVHSMQGKIVLESHMSIKDNLRAGPLNVADLKSGIYIVTILMDNGLTGSCRFVK
jgi:parallel beta-helix repeat protein